LDRANLTDSRILIVDDQTANLKALSAVLEFAGYNNVKCLHDSRDAIQAVSEFDPQLILLDLHMPHVDGLGVMDQLRRMNPPPDYLPVLVLTGDGRSEAKEQALSRGASDFLSKPLNTTEVELRVRNLLQSGWLHLQLKKQNASLEKQVVESNQLTRELALTNRKLQETQAHLIQSEKMASLGQLVAGIAHEINNPLAFVLNNLFVVQENLKKLSAEVADTGLPRLEKISARLADMQEGAERVKDLVSKLRTFSRLDEGTFKTVDIHESIESVLLFLRHKMAGRIEVERDYRAPDELSCFAGELNQVLMNIIANAIDSIEGTGKITLTTKRQDGSFVMTVRDTGKGIPETIRNRIFEPFFTTKPVGHGTGLGLAISYGIVKAHKGSIQFTTEEGKGTEFVLSIPASLSMEAANDPNGREAACTDRR
jgi:two-component system, NtrC family, sensor kinase